MDETDIKRKLATILVADIVGYSRLTANDEDWTIRSLGDFRKIVDDIITRHDGRIFSTGGDSVLAEFASPVEAVRCAVDFQEASRSRNLLQPRDRQLRYRIGINLGDVMVRGGDLLGDGVNVAARLEGIAEPGGICVSASVWEHINGKLSIGYVDIGEQSVKNIPRPVRAYHLRVDGSVGEVADMAHPAPAASASRADKPDAQKPPMTRILGGAAAAIIIVLAGLLAWQMWPKGAGSPTTSTAPPAAPSGDPLAARLASVSSTMTETQRADAVRFYNQSAMHKATAIALGATGNWVTFGRKSTENARDSVLELCQIAAGQPCALLATDDTLQPIPSDRKWLTRDMPRVHYSGAFDPAQMPGAPLEVRDSRDFTEYASITGPKAIAFHLAGTTRFFAATHAADQHAAEVDALKVCNNNERDARADLRPCYLYASGYRVVFPLRLKEPLTAEAPSAPIAIPPAAPAPAAAQQAAPAPQPAPQPTSASRAEPPKTFRDCPNCPEMIVIPAGSFQMGAAPGENQRFEVPSTESERAAPQHKVNLAKPFALGKFDITRAEFAAFAKTANFHARPGCMTVTNGNWSPQEQATWENPGFPQTERDPVVCMNEVEIDAYLGWLRQTTGKNYRLPSEAEWEYAARGGTTTAFYWGDDPKDACTYENVGDETHKEKSGVSAAMPCRDGFADSSPVGSFKPNPFGLYDMAGNIAVLTADCWNETYAGAPSDGLAWMSGDCARRAARKAGFDAVRPWKFRTDNRLAEGNVVKRNRFGFRVALSLP